MRERKSLRVQSCFSFFAPSLALYLFLLTAWCVYVSTCVCNM